MHRHMCRRNFLGSLALLFPSSRLGGQTKTPPKSELAGSIADAANALLAVLRPELRRQLEFAFDDPERKDWSNVPHFVHPRKGARFGDFNPQERRAAHDLLRAILSSQGYYKALQIIERDEWLSENSRPVNPAGGTVPGPGTPGPDGTPPSEARFGSEFYFLDVFGKPGGDAPWGVQLDGHHLAVNVTVIDNAVTVTPTFLGAEPATIPSGRHAGWQVLGGESTKAFALRNALTADEARRAVIAETVPRDIFTGPGRDDALKSLAGVSSLQGRQRNLLESLVDEYLGNVPPEVAREYRSAIQNAGFDELHFGWMGPAEMGKPVYYRVHGPALLIEYENMPPLNPSSGTGANHVHTVLRVPGNDFGEDWLRRHHQENRHT
jgi:hypothetical protein